MFRARLSKGKDKMSKHKKTRGRSLLKKTLASLLIGMTTIYNIAILNGGGGMF